MVIRMITLTYEQKQALGFQFVLDSLAPCCIYGRDEVKKTGPYPVEEQKELLAELERLKNLSACYEACRSRIDKISRILMNMKEIRGSLKKGCDSILNDVELFELKQFLLQTERLHEAYGELSRDVILPGIFLKDTRGALDILDPEKKRMPGFYIEDAYSEKLKEVRKEKKQLEVVLRQEPNGGVTAMGGITAIGSTADMEEKKQWLLDKRKKLVILEEEEQQRIREEIITGLRPYFKAVLTNTKMAGKLDFLIQKAVAAMKYDGVCPEITREQLELVGITNPNIQELLRERGKAFVPITFSMGKGTAVVTGANMGGKSVALRTIALNIVLAQSGFFVYAKKARVPMYDYMCMVAGEFQDMPGGLSSFGGEIMELQKSMERLETGFGFLLFDELARGTNPDEGAAIVQAVVKFLKNQNAMTIVATHYDHVAEYADCHYQVMGLKNVDIKKLEKEIRLAEIKKGIDIISKYMDYGIYPVHGQEDCPRDAIHICSLLGLDERIMGLIKM